MNFNKCCLHIANLNICHIKPKLDDIKIMLSESKNVDILGLCETFLDSSVDDETLHIPNYRFERKDRTSTHNMVGKLKGGGIIIYLANHLNFKRRADFETSEVESIWIEINIKHNKPIFVCSIYRPLFSNCTMACFVCIAIG